MTDAPQIAILSSRGVIAVSGPEAREFLQGIITNNIDLVNDTCAIYAALLMPQGKLMFEFFIAEADGKLLFDCHKDHLPALLKRLTMYRLRADALIEDVSDSWQVAAAFGASAANAALPGVVFDDPRLPALGKRSFVPASESVEANADEQDYEAWRLACGVPNMPADAGQDQTFMLEANFDELHGVDFKKGCYIGQELASRMKRRNGLRKRLLPVNVDGPLPAPGTDVTAGERRIGEMRTGIGSRAIAYLRLDRLEEAKDEQLTADGVPLFVDWPDWIPR
jgi:folate-binding protein YgfZ